MQYYIEDNLFLLENENPEYKLIILQIINTDVSIENV